MVKGKKKLVDISDEDKSTESYGRDKTGKIIKLEDKGNPESRALKFRIGAVGLWILAIIFEIVAILRLNNIITLWPSLDMMWFLIIFILLDLAAFIPGSLLWKKANHIDPVSEKNPTKFWLVNNLGTVLSVLAFLPIIVAVLMNKNLDSKSKAIVSVIATLALLIAGVASYDFNPVSSEQLQRAQAEVSAVSDTGHVYWGKYSKKYHVDPDCPAFSQSDEIYEGTVAQAFEKGLTDACRRCIPALGEHDHDHNHNHGGENHDEENN